MLTSCQRTLSNHVQRVSGISRGVSDLLVQPNAPVRRCEGRGRSLGSRGGTSESGSPASARSTDVNRKALLLLGIPREVILTPAGIVQDL